MRRNGDGAVTAAAPAPGGGVPYTLGGALAGVRKIVPLALSTFVFGLAIGVVAREVGLSLAEVTLMSGLMWAGSAQFAALELGGAAMPLLPVVLVSVAVNARYLLMSAAMRPWFSRLPTLKAYLSLAFLADGNWALALREHAAGRSDAAFLVGSGALMYLAWVAGTASGHALGATLANPERWGLDFVATAFFVTILVTMRRGRADLLPWSVAGASAALAALLLPGHWYVLIGGLAGSLAGALRHDA